MSGQADAGSFRDPRGAVYVTQDRVFRTVMPVGVEDYEFVRSTGLFDDLVEAGLLVNLKEVDLEILGDQASGASYLLEHPKLPFISYPYEWPFAALKAAALLQLDIYLRALEHGVTLTDATAYNIQFQGPQPIFIDHLAFRRYQEGEYWLAHRQYCEQFLNPLLLRAKVGIPHNAWYRGALEGISAQDLSAVLPFRKKLSWNVFTQVVLQASLQKASMGKETRSIVPTKSNFSKTAYRNILVGLQRSISGLKIPDSEKSVWGNYAQDNSYGSDEARQKRAFVCRFAAAVKPEMIWDIGCNTGDYSKAALESGAANAIGFDFDQLALDAGYARAGEENLSFLPLFLDAANPPPNQGWAQVERKGLSDRASAQGLLALALVHHLAITKNIPLCDVVDWIVGMAPNGVVEFVPKNDAMVQELLRLREDIFDDYTEDVFVASLERNAEIVEMETVSEAGRKLVWYKRR